MTTMGSKAGIGVGRNPWRRLWQVPLLVAGVVVFVLGARAVVRTIKPVAFETHLQDVRGLLGNKKYAKAIEQINTLSNYYQADAEHLAPLCELAGDAHYLAQQDEPALVEENYAKAIELYAKAVRLGAAPTVQMNERWGLSALALGRGAEAVEKLEEAVKGDPALLGSHAREMERAYAAVGQRERAREVTERVLKAPEVEVGDRVWALSTRIELAMAAGSGGGVGAELERAIGEGLKALSGIAERNPAGELLTWIGRAEFERGQMDEAYEHLSEARKRFVVHNMDDGRAAVLLGKIAQSRGDLETALREYQEVVTSHAGTRLWAAGRLGRAEVLALSGKPNEVMEEDYRYVMGELAGGGSGARKGGPEMVELGQVRASLVGQYERYTQANKTAEALKFLALQQELKEEETAAMAYRLASSRERRGYELLDEARVMAGADGGAPAAVKARAARQAAGLGMLAQSAADYQRHAKLSTMQDAISGASLWRAAQLYDEAGQTEKSIGVYEQFVIQRPRDVRVPEGLLAIGQLYQSLGQREKATEYYERNIQQNPKTPAAYTSTLSLARCSMAQGAEGFGKAEAALLSLVQDNREIQPQAIEFRASLFTLGELYYRNQRWSDGILRLEECIARYPEDKGAPRAKYMLAESYRHSGLEIGAAVKAEPGIEHRDALEKARQERLRRAAGLFEQVIGLIDEDPSEAKALLPLDEEYLRSAYMDRSECYFELGEYATAIKLYDQAAARFAQHVTAVEAYVQIVNAYRALNEPAQASAAAERARWILKRVPDEQLGKGALGLSRQYYEDFLKLGKGP